MEADTKGPALDLYPIRRALLSVSDKTRITELGAALAAQNIQLLSTDGTAAALKQAGLEVTEVAEMTGFPEAFDGRVKTLHPMVHGPLLFKRDNEKHVSRANSLGIKPIDLLVVNLYPFIEVMKNPKISPEKANEQIDIGGPALIRGAAKNHRHVAVVTDPLQYDDLILELAKHQGSTTLRFREKLKVDAFVKTAQYDEAIARYMGTHYNPPGVAPYSTKEIGREH